MRQGEIAGLQWPDIDFTGQTISIRRSRSRYKVDGEVVENEPKTDRGRRIVELDGRTVSLLRQHRTSQVAERLAAGSVWQDSDHVFVWQDGRPLRPDWIYHRFVKLVAGIDLPRIPFHGLRDTHATLMLRAGVHPKIVQERLGHHSAAFTLDVYSAVTVGMQRDAIERLSRALGDK